jgi:hydroxylysine kinase
MGTLDMAVFGASMTTAVAQTAKGQAEALLRSHYGLQAQASRLASERDELFLVDTEDGRKFVLRLANPADDEAVLDMQVRALAWIAQADPTLPVPRTVPSLDGADQGLLEVGSGVPRTVRLSSWLAGRPLAGSPRSARQRRAIGSLLARLGQALRGFEHRGADHVLAWDIQRASALHQLVPRQSPDARWDWVRRGLDRFETIVKPRLPELRAQVVHGDFNPHNLLVDAVNPDLLSGVLDFGDMVRTPLVNDLAIAACYHACEASPLAHIADVVAAYHAIVPLMRQELDLLVELAVTRLCAAVTITEWRARRYPDNARYILKNTAIAWAALEHLADVDRAAAAAFLRQACGME